MKPSYEDRYVVAEDRHPWFVARRELFGWLAGSDRSARILDVGCGTGRFLVHLKQLGFESLAGCEPSARLRGRFRDPSIELFSDLPERHYDRIFLLDVLEHIEDDRKELARLRRRLDVGGLLLLSVPAHPFLWSHHDEMNRHYRRYRRSELGARLREAGFEVHRLSYWNMSAFPAICLSRWLGIGRGSSDLEVGGSLILTLLGGLLRLENRLLRGVSLPFGVSLIAMARAGECS